MLPPILGVLLGRVGAGSGWRLSGATYLASHLRKNDYWAEGEKEVEGEWIGLSAQAMNLHGPVTAAPFEALRSNRHPETGEPLTPRDALERTAFFDIQLSAPKDVSVLAMVGGDERVKAAFVESVHGALREMERYAAVRERRGDAATSEEFRLTGNYVGALFFHDASRDLDPQLHAHAVLANVTFAPARKQWMALPPAEMLRASPSLRQVLDRELGSRLRDLGYEVENMSAVGFNLKGLEHLRARFSKRSKQVERLAPDFSAWTYGHALTAYRSQGATSEASLLVLGSTASVALEHRQFYVGSTRYRGSHKIYVADKMAILGRITRGRQDRELASEFVDRHHLSAGERILPRPVRRWRKTLQRAWRAMVDRLLSHQKIQQRQAL